MSEGWSRQGSALLEWRALGCDGKTNQVVTVFKDFTERHMEEEAIRRLDQASQLLASSISLRDTLGQLGQLVVPIMTDLCAIDLQGAGGEPPLALVFHSDPQLAARAQQLRERYPCGLECPFGGGGGRQDREVGALCDRWRRGLRGPPRTSGLLEHLGRSSSGRFYIVPIAARGKTFGALSFASAESGRRFDSGDLRFAEEFAHRIGIAIDNARLYQQAQDAVRVREDFMSIASHELKTPLTSLALQIEMGRQVIRRAGEPPPEWSRLPKVLESSARQVGRVTHLIDDLLDVSAFRPES